MGQKSHRHNSQGKNVNRARVAKQSNIVAKSSKKAKKEKKSKVTIKNQKENTEKRSRKRASHQTIISSVPGSEFDSCADRIFQASAYPDYWHFWPLAIAFSMPARLVSLAMLQSLSFELLFSVYSLLISTVCTIQNAKTIIYLAVFVCVLVTFKLVF
ncbi:hypothetical protein Tco_0534855 [Tanacetum coccineum]